ncbi:MAG: acetylxylan esterase [Armatimonadia bacterium]
MMKRTLLLVLLVALAVSAGFAQAPAEGDKYVVKAALDRPEGIYKCGEEATFSITILKNDQPVTTGEFDYLLSVDGTGEVAKGKAQLGTEPTQIKGTLTAPGILQLKLTEAQYRTPPNYGVPIGAAYEPEKIVPLAPEPEDFMTFWEASKAEVRAIPADMQMVKVDASSNAEQTTYKVSFANILGTRIYGWLSVPTKEGKFPAILNVPAAGYRPNGPGTGWAAKGFLSMVLFAHNYDVDLPKETYDEASKGPLGNYRWENRDNRDTFYFRKVFMGCTRFMDYLMSRPEWNGKDLIVTGSSQGGGLSLVCSGLEPKVTAIAANVSALCDHSAVLYGRTPGWPRLIPNNDPVIAKVAAYYDAVNFARHAKCTSLLSTGYADTTCAPSSVYAAYSVLPEPKRMIPTPTMGHSQSPEYSKACGEFINALGKF